jgi:uncharacterized protein involved in response to NO
MVFMMPRKRKTCVVHCDCVMTSAIVALPCDRTMRCSAVPFFLSPAHPLWLVGFRPFFTLAIVSAIALPTLWAAMLAGWLPYSPHGIAPMSWHAHEMFYGFGWAILGGFLLTATKNWVSIRGYHGMTLMALVLAWLAERVAMWFYGDLSTWMQIVANNLFVGALVVLLVSTLVVNRAKDIFRRDNLFFLAVLPLFLLAKNLMLNPSNFTTGSSMTLALFRMAFLIMLERTLTQFMKNTFSVAIWRNRWLDGAIKLSALSLIGLEVWPVQISAGLEVLVALLLLIRYCTWKPHLVLRKLEIAVMYLGYLAIVAQLLLDAILRFSPQNWAGSLPMHVFTFGAMGMIIPAMIVRMANGHTGRKVDFQAQDLAILALMLVAFVLRVVVSQFARASYSLSITSAAAAWVLAFAWLGWRHIPKLWQARVDGKAH